MSKFIVDAQLPARLKKWIEQQGFDVKHTTELPYGNLIEDTYIIQIADEEERIIITKDKDFHHHHLVSGKPDRILHIATGNITNKDLIKLFESHFDTIATEFENGAKVIEMNNEAIIIHE